MKSLQYIVIIDIALSALFTLTTVSFSPDVSLSAFPLSLAFTAWLVYALMWLLLRKKDISRVELYRKLLQYQPFVYISAFALRRSGSAGCAFALDLVSAILWFLEMVVSFVLLYALSEKRVYGVCTEWKEYHRKHPEVKPSGWKFVLSEALGWIDALVQAVFTIVLVNLFIVQLYAIPSESMVPTFLIKDRVTVFKTSAGPKFPLSDVGIPYIQHYKRGDIVVFRNPHYSDDHKSEVKSFMAQMLTTMTLTLVNINTDENGELKADPLVKRVTGLPGEQLMLMDGKLYARTAADPEFHEVEEDASWAAWSLNSLSADMKSRIRYIPLTTAQYDSTLEVERMRRELNLAQAAARCDRIVAALKAVSGCDLDYDDEVPSLFTASEMYEYSFFNGINDVAAKVLGSDGGIAWFEHFMTDWYKDLGDLSAYTEDGAVSGSHLVGGDLYSDARFRLNVMAKIVAGRLILRTAQLVDAGVAYSSWHDDEERTACFVEAQKLNDYNMRMDQRNMGVFPANDSDGNPVYIPEDCYFMMGDNRYNSADMRHSYERELEALTPYDPYSLAYYTYMAPRYVSRNKILGKAGFRYWPIDRMGVPRPVYTSK